MKRIFLTLLTFICLNSSTTKAQDYNFGFETWENHGTYEEPQFWGTFNPVQFVGIQALKDSVNPYLGNYSLKLSAGAIPAAIAVLGTINTNSAIIAPGRPYNQRPVKMSCYYKTILINNDSSAIATFLTKYNTTTNQRDTIASAGKLFYSNVDTWTYLEIPFTYLSTETPDTMGIILSATANPDGFGNEGCELYIDEIEFEIPASIDDNTSKISEFNIFPNPAKDELTVTYTGSPEKSFIRIFDLQGKELFSSVFSTTQKTISLKGIASGAFSIRIENEKEIIYRSTFIKE